MKSQSSAISIGVLAAVLTTAPQIQAQSSEPTLLPNLTVNNTAFIKGTAKFGTLGGTTETDGFRIDVAQSQISRLRHVWHPATDNSWTELVPIWGEVDTSWDEEFGHYVYEDVEVTPAVPGYYATEEYEISPAVPAQHNLISPAIPAQHNLISPATEAVYDDNDYDMDGNPDHILVEPAHEAVYQDIPEMPAVYEDIPGTPAVMGTRQGAWISEQPATYTTQSRWVVDYIMHHQQSSMQVIGEDRVLHTEDVIPAHFSSEVLAGEPSPVTRFTGTHPEMAFAWANLTDGVSERRDLMTLSSGGLLFPRLGDTWGYAKASLSQDTFEQSWTGPEWSGEDTASIAYHSYGSRMGKQEMKLWNHGGDYVSSSETEVNEGVERVLARDETTLTPGGITIERSDTSDSGGNSLRTTHITPDFATFSGSVAVKGVLRVQPAGDLEMGQFTQGPQP